MGDLDTQVGHARCPRRLSEGGNQRSVLPEYRPIVRRGADPSFVGYARSADRRGPRLRGKRRSAGNVARAQAFL